MTFVKPSTITNQDGAYTYKEGIGSPSTNYIDNQFPNCLDKTNGDTITGVITINNNGQISVLPGGGIVFQSGSGGALYAGSNFYVDGNLDIESGGYLNVESGGSFRILSGGAGYVLSGGSLFIDNGGTLESTNSANVKLYGTATSMTDNQSPQLASAPVARNIAQPLVLMTSHTPGDLSGQHFSDVINQNDWDLMITDLPDGCVITGFLISIQTGGTAPTSSDAGATLYSYNNATQSLSGPLASVTVSSGLSNITVYQLTSSSCSVTVNKSVNSYFVRINASSTQPLIWAAPIIQTTISTVAQLA